MKRRQVGLQVWKHVSVEPGDDEKTLQTGHYSGNQMVLAAVARNGKLMPASDDLQLSPGDLGYFLVFLTEAEAAADFLQKAGWEQEKMDTDDGFTTSTCHLE